MDPAGQLLKTTYQMTAPNLQRSGARYVWRWGCWVLVSFPTLGRAYAALARLVDQGRAAEYDGHASNGRHWIKIAAQ